MSFFWEVAFENIVSYCCWWGSIAQEVLRIVVRSGKTEMLNHTDKYGNTPLLIAAFRGSLPMVSFLLANGADKTIQNQDGQDCCNAAEDSFALAGHICNLPTRFKPVENIQRVEGKQIINENWLDEAHITGHKIKEEIQKER